MSALELRPTEPGDLPGLSALFAERFGHPLEPEEWEWKYRLLPGEGRSLVAVAPDGGLLAHAGALLLPARWRSGEGGIWQLVDFAGTSRRSGLAPALVALGRRLLEDLPRAGEAPWIFGFPSERHFRLGERAFGYRPLAEVRPLAGAVPEARVPPGTEMGWGDSAPPWAEAAWSACGVLGIRRSAAFLDWRYYARPRRYYRVYRLVSGPEYGFAVFAFVGGEAWAAELWLPPAGEWYPSMLAIAADLRAAGLRTWRFWPPPPAARRLDALLAALGLEPSAETRFVGCRGKPGGEDPVAAAAGFHYAMGDYDLV